MLYRLLLMLSERGNAILRYWLQPRSESVCLRLWRITAESGSSRRLLERLRDLWLRGIPSEPGSSRCLLERLSNVWLAKWVVILMRCCKRSSEHIRLPDLLGLLEAEGLRVKALLL